MYFHSLKSITNSYVDFSIRAVLLLPGPVMKYDSSRSDTLSEFLEQIKLNCFSAYLIFKTEKTSVEQTNFYLGSTHAFTSFSRTAYVIRLRLRKTDMKSAFSSIRKVNSTEASYFLNCWITSLKTCLIWLLSVLLSNYFVAGLWRYDCGTCVAKELY